MECYYTTVSISGVLSQYFQANGRFQGEGVLKGSNRTGWYTKDTCVEFHKLLLSALIAYMNALRIFEKLRKERVAYVDLLGKAGYLLWRIANSCILRHHLKLLCSVGLLAHPIRPLRNVELDQEFGCLTRTGHVKRWELQVESKEKEEAQTERKEVENNDSENDTEDNESEHPGHEDNDEIEEFLSLRSSEPKDLEKTYLTWIQLQTAYWTAQEIIMSPQTLSAVDPKNFKISVVNAKFPSRYDRTLVSWIPLIKELPLPRRVNADDVISKIKREIDKHRGNPRCHPIFKTFGSAPSYELGKFTGNLHAEVALAFLIKGTQTTGSLEDFIQVRICQGVIILSIEMD